MGAAVLASTAIKTGCGLVTAFVPEWDMISFK
jgi:hypothetical protein